MGGHYPTTLWGCISWAFILPEESIAFFRSEDLGCMSHTQTHTQRTKPENTRWGLRTEQFTAWNVDTRSGLGMRSPLLVYFVEVGQN